MTHKFWNEQPIQQINDYGKNGIISKNLQSNHMDLPAAFKWWNIDVENKKDLLLLQKFLNEHYIEDDKCIFRMDYSVELLKQFLTPPGYRREWHVGIINCNNIIGFIAGIPINLKVDGEVRLWCEINFLCVHKKFRNNNLAPLLINEVINKCIDNKIYNAIYTIAKVITKPVSCAKYWHKIINYEKMIKIGFCGVPTYAIRDNKLLPNLRQMQRSDVDIVCKLLNDYMKKFDISMHFDNNDVIHWFLSNGHIYSYVLEDITKIPTDFISFYGLKSSVLNSTEYDFYKTAYCFYYSVNTVSLTDLIDCILGVAKGLGFDVFTMNTIMNNDEIVENNKLNFEKGTGNLYYYLYNYHIYIHHNL